MLFLQRYWRHAVGVLGGIAIVPCIVVSTLVPTATVCESVGTLMFNCWGMIDLFFLQSCDTKIKIYFYLLPSIPMTCNSPCTINGCSARRKWYVKNGHYYWRMKSLDQVRGWILSICWRVTEIANLHNESYLSTFPFHLMFGIPLLDSMKYVIW